MVRKKGKSVSFDAMVKFFMQNYNIPTKKDLKQLMIRLDQLEQTIMRMSGETAKGGRRISRGRAAATASDTVLEIIKRFKQGVGFSDIQARTGFEEKKLRNIIYRLNKMGKITRKSRGLYILS
jgi:hypothetical protein